MYTLSVNVGATRVCSGGNISHPCGNPALPEERDQAFMRKTIEGALELLGTEVETQKLKVIER